MIALIILSLLLLAPITAIQASSISRSSSTGTRPSSNEKNEKQFPLNKPDRLVEAAPLAVVAVCEDGVAFIALHTAAIYEPLLVDLERDNEESTTPISEDDESKKTFFRDLPQGYRGALRIAPLDDEGTTILSVGWRADCTTLASKCRSLASSEKELYGTVVIQEGEDSQMRRIRSLSYGQLLARDISKWMAQCVFSDNVRGLSCVSLLSTTEGNLWLVDATGAYRTRAHAIGQGSQFVNQRLSKVDFSKMSVEKGASKLLDIIKEKGCLESNIQWKLSPKSAVEIALLLGKSRRIKRVKQNDLFM